MKMVVIFFVRLDWQKANRTPRIHLLVVSGYSVLNGFIVRSFIIVEFIVTVGRIELPRDKQKTVGSKSLLCRPQIFRMN